MLKIRNEKTYTTDEFIEYSSNHEGRFELINGFIYNMSSPTVNHQRIVKFISDVFTDFFRNKKCEVFISPLDVYLSESDIFQPDVFVVCDMNKISDNGIHGAPDLVVEVVSKSTASNYYLLKCYKYMTNDVKEYWIVDYQSSQILKCTNIDNYSLAEYDLSKIESTIFNGLVVDFSNLEVQKEQETC